MTKSHQILFWKDRPPSYLWVWQLHTFFWSHQHPDVQLMWKQLKDNGLLQGKLISHVWSRFSPIDQLRLLDIMEQFELICAAPRDNAKHDLLALEYKQTESDESISALICQKNYYVPSQFNPGNVKDMGPLAQWQSLTFFVDFHGLFTSMISRPLSIDI